MFFSKWQEWRQNNEIRNSQYKFLASIFDLYQVGSMWIIIIMVNTSFSGVRFWLKVFYRKTWIEVSCCFAFEILRKLILTSGCDPLSLSFTTRDTTTVLFESQLTSCKTKIVTIDWSLSSDQCHVCEVHSAYRILWINFSENI